MPDMKAIAEETRRDYRQMLTHRNEIRDELALICKYVLFRNASWGDTNRRTNTGKRTVKDVHDDTAIECADAAAAAYVGALWPNAEESFETIPHPLMMTSPEMKDSLTRKDVKAYYSEVTRRGREPFRNPDCNWLVSFSEHMKEQLTLATSGVLGEEDEYDNENPCFFRAVSIENCLIAEGPRNKIDRVCFEYQWTVSQVVARFKLENCSATVKELNETPEGRDKYVRFIHMIRPRPKGKVGARKDKKPWEHRFMELDGDHILQIDGSDYLTAWMARFEKRPNELYGRGLAGKAMPTIREMNVLRKSMGKSIMLHYEYPVGIRTNMFGGAESIDLGPNGQNPIYEQDGMTPSPRPPVEKLLDVPEPRVGSERMTNLEERCMVKFQLDKLMDFANKQRMTLGEAKMRGDFRNQALGMYFGRQMTEVLHPAVMWVLSVHWRRKLLGLHPKNDLLEIQKQRAKGILPLIIPDVVADFWDRTGKLPFAIRFVSPAARAMASDSLDGIEQFTNYVLALVKGGVPEAIDNLDVDRSCELYAHHVGTPPDALRASDEREDARKSRQQMQQQMAELQAGEQQSQIEKNKAKAAKDNSQAGVQPGGPRVGAA